MSRWVISSNAKVESTNVQLGILALGEVGKVAQHVCSGETAVPHIRLAKTQFGKPCPIGPAIENPDRVCFRA